jgi:SPX domain
VPTRKRRVTTDLLLASGQALASTVSPSLLDDSDFGVVDTGIELEDFAGGERAVAWGAKSNSGREAQREEKKRRKRQELADREEMKFSHSIQFNAVPDWSSNYISYSNLKKLYVVPCCLTTEEVIN